MMSVSKQVVDVPGLFDSRPLGYRQCIAAGNLIFVAGQTGVDAEGMLADSNFEAQARQALANLRAALEAAGATPTDIVASTLWLTDMSNLRRFGAIRAEVMPEFESTMTAIGVACLARPELRIEISAIAVKSGN